MPRPGGYAIIFDGAGLIAVVSTPLGMFLPGGGQTERESPEEAVIREVEEECGLRIMRRRRIGIADEMIFAEDEHKYYRKRCRRIHRLAEGSKTDRCADIVVAAIRPSEECWCLMDLELESGRIIRGATSDDILAHIDGEEFAILSTAPQSYIQCAEQNEPPYEYELEYRDGSQDRHYRAVDGPITLDRVISAFIWYLQGDSGWRSKFRWERIEFPPK